MNLQIDAQELRILTTSLQGKLKCMRNKQIKESKRMPSKSKELAEAENTIKGTHFAIARLENCIANLMDISLELKKQGL